MFTICTGAWRSRRLVSQQHYTYLCIIRICWVGKFYLVRAYHRKTSCKPACIKQPQPCIYHHIHFCYRLWFIHFCICFSCAGTKGFRFYSLRNRINFTGTHLNHRDHDARHWQSNEQRCIANSICCFRFYILCSILLLQRKRKPRCGQMGFLFPPCLTCTGLKHGTVTVD